MGPEDSEKKAVKVYMMADGQPVEINPEIAEITYAGENTPGYDDLALPECEITFQIKRPKSMRCKSRKRLVKLLMARGISRNMARVLAINCVVWRNRAGIPAYLKISYQRYFDELWFSGAIKL